MAMRDRMMRLAKAKYLPRRTVRLRLTVLYGALFLASGAALLAITYFFVDASTGNAFIVHNNNGTTIAGFQIGSPVNLLHQTPGQAAKQLRSNLAQPATGARGSASGGAVTTGGS